MLKAKGKENFLDLAYITSNYDGSFAEEEKEMIYQYRRELQLSNDEYEIKKNSKIEDILDEFNKCEKRIKNAIFIELVGLVLSDNCLDDKEKEVINTIIKKFDINEDLYQKSVTWIQKLNKVY